VITLNHHNFQKFQKLVNLMLHNTTVNTEKEKVNWLKIKLMRFDKSESDIIQHNMDYKIQNLKRKLLVGKKFGLLLVYYVINTQSSYTD